MPRYSIDDWTAVKERLRLGDSIRECAKSTGVDRGAVFKWSHMDLPPDRMVLTMDIPDNPIPCARTSPKQRLTYEDRCFIAALLDVGRTKQEIAARMGISRTTVARELTRTQEPYDPKARPAGCEGKGKETQASQARCQRPP